MMPRVALQRGAFDGTAHAERQAEHRLFDHNHRQQHRQREPMRSLMRRHDLTNALRRDQQCRSQQQHRDDHARHGFRLAVAVGMILVRRNHCHAQPAPHHDRAEDVRRGFDAVGDEDVGIAENPGGDLDRREEGVDQQSQLREAQSCFDGGHLSVFQTGCRV